MGILGSTWDFIANHKKKFIALLLTIALGYGGFHFMKRALLAKLAEVGEIGKALERKRKKEAELARLRGECTSTISTFLGPLRKQLSRLTDVVPVTNELKELRTRQKMRRPSQTQAESSDDLRGDQLWEDLKVFSIARLMSSVYALTLIDLLLRVQLHVAAKKALDSREADPDQTLVTPKVREQFMFKATDFFVTQGLETLLGRIKNSIQVVTVSWKMGSDSSVSKAEIMEQFRAIREHIETPDEAGQLSASAHTWFLSCVIQPDEALARAKQDVDLTQSQAQELKLMLDETMDLLESPHFAAVLEEALSSLFDLVLQDLSAKQLEGRKEMLAATSKPEEERYILAKVIVGVKLFAKHVLATTEEDAEDAEDQIVTESNRYVNKLENLSALEELSRAILNLGSEDTEELEGLGDMKELLPLLASMGGQGGDLPNNFNPESLLPLLQGQNPGGMPPPPGAAPPQIANGS